MSRSEHPSAVLPLYQGAADRARRSARGNAGLWFDKFCNTWTRRGRDWSMQAVKDAQPKLDWIHTITGSATGTRDQIEESVDRRLRMIRRRGGRAWVFVTASRFVTGLGRAHPVENGFAWDHVLGTPYLAGSSVKGLVHAWAREEADPRPTDDEMTAVFGGAGESGGVCFLDAIPLGPVRLEADIMTPHYIPWDASDPPGDWRSPTPIPFLVTAAETRFLFGVVPRTGEGRDRVERVAEWLVEALEWAGAGAKTAVGYGRMREDRDALGKLEADVRRAEEEADARRREERRLAGLGPHELELEEIAQARADVPPYRAWLEAAEAGRWDDDPDTRADVLKRIKSDMQDAGEWTPESRKKKPEKDRPHVRTRSVMRMLGEEG